MAGINWQGMVSLNGTVSQHVPMYMNMYLSVKIRGGLNTVSVNITLANLNLTRHFHCDEKCQPSLIFAGGNPRFFT